MTVIRVEQLSKSYRLGALGGGTLRADVSRWLAKLRGLPDPNLKIGHEHRARLEGQEFWALRDVGFEVKAGEILGIIGRNGAGKSTLLKILSRVTAPSSGLVKVRGRIASLLEVGTGFHPELTGRENIFLNGAILGMSKAEIKKKFDDIVAFSEVEAFIETPVKRYSSGMYVRLAFAVAAHLEPEILIVDEVLAVGDAEFQKKCLGKMDEVAKGGRTVLFVSHNLAAVQTLCNRGILLSDGKLQQQGSAKECIETYLCQAVGANGFKRPQSAGKDIGIVGGRLKRCDQAGEPRMQVEVEISSRRSCLVSLDLRLFERAGLPVGFGSLGALQSDQLISLHKGRNDVAFCFPLSSLANGSYTISLDLTFPAKEYLERIEHCLSFDFHQPGAIDSNGALQQNWGYGSYQIVLERVDCQISQIIQNASQN